MRITLRQCYPVSIDVNFRSHWGVAPWTPDGVWGDDAPEDLRGKPRYRGVQHPAAPRSWPWWMLCKVDLVALRAVSPSSGSRLWVYSRWGSGFIDVYVDRRAEQY